MELSCVAVSHADSLNWSSPSLSSSAEYMHLIVVRVLYMGITHTTEREFTTEPILMMSPYFLLRKLPIIGKSLYN